MGGFSVWVALVYGWWAYNGNRAGRNSRTEQQLWHHEFPVKHCFGW